MVTFGESAEHSSIDASAQFTQAEVVGERSLMVSVAWYRWARASVPSTSIATEPSLVGQQLPAHARDWK